VSYTPEDQDIEAPTTDMLAALERLRSACTARIIHGRWIKTHLIELNEMRKKLNDIEIDLLRLIDRIQ
jgi:hypothetical protein